MKVGTIAAAVAGAVMFLIIGIAIGRGEGARPVAAPPPPGASEPASGPAITLPVRAAEAPRAAPAEPDRFAFVTYRSDMSGAQPRACLVFSAPLDARKDYATFVEAAPGAPLAFTAAGDSLCVGGLAFGETRDLTLRAGLPAADGRTLGRDETVPVEFADRPAYVGFVGGGVILPRIDADGLAVETVNVAKVAVRVARVNDRALAFKRISAGFTVAEGDYAYRWGEDDASDVDTLVWEGEMDVADRANTPVVTVFPLAAAVGALEPGAYVVTVSDVSRAEPQYGERALAERWILFTDLALTSYHGETGVDVMVRSLESALPVRGVEVRVIARNNAVLGQGVTDDAGRVKFDAPIVSGTGNDAPALIVAYGASGDFAVLDLDRAPLDLSNDAVDGRAAPGLVDSFVYTDRGIYRPGETVHAVALLRDAEGVAIGDRAGHLVLTRPNGLEAARHRLEPGATAAGGFGWDYALPKSAARGQWRLAVLADGVGEVGAADFAVEDFVPQRVALELAADAETPIVDAAPRPIAATARFLYGAPGAGLEVLAEGRLVVDDAPFAAFDGYRFGRTDDGFEGEFVEIAPAVADGAGVANLSLALDGRGASATRPLQATVIASVIEPGGRAVREAVRVPYRPRAIYLGTKPRFEDGSVREGARAVFDVVAVDALGAVQPRDLSYRVTSVDYDYDWYRDESGAWRWRRTRLVDVVAEGRVQITGRAAELSLPNLPWGDYELLISDADSGAETQTGFYVGWGGTDEDGVEAPDRLRVALGTDRPRVGQDAGVSITSPYAGKAQVVVATNRVIDVYLVDVAANEPARLNLPVTSAWGPGAYVLVTAFTPRDPVEQSRPRRAVGAVYVPVDTDARSFEVTLGAPEVIRPNGKLEIDVAATGGPDREAVWLTLAAVDEGILRLTKFESPDPVDFFFGQRALGVDLRDDYGRLLDPNLGAGAPIRQGGDALGGEGLTVVPTKSVALFSGLVAVERDGRAKITLDVPDFQGELRLMAVVWSQSGVGGASRGVIVRDPVPAQVVLPRFLAPGDEAVATVTVDNVEGAPGSYTTTLAAASGPLSVLGEAVTQELARGERGDAAVRISADAEGIAQLRLESKGPQNFAVARTADIQVRSAFLPERRVERRLMAPGETFTLAAASVSGFTPGSGSATVSFSALPLDPAALFASLDRYPYGCTEQITSRALPLLYVSELGSLIDANEPGATRGRVQEALNTVLERQSPSGAIGLWREGDGDASPFLGAYAMDFVARAKAAGYAVPDEAVERGYAALRAVASGNRWAVDGYSFEAYGPIRSESEAAFVHLQRGAMAYAHYVLARGGQADVSRLRYLHDSELDQFKSPLARAHLGAALAAIGDTARAVNAFEKAEAAIGFSQAADYYQSATRDLAGVLALAAEAGDTARVERLSARLSDAAEDPESLTTQEKAYALMAAHALLGDGDGVSVTRDGEALPGRAVAKADLDAAAISGEVAFANTGPNPVWRTVITRGAPTAPPAAQTSRLTVAKTTHALDGTPLDLAALTQGDQVVIKVTLTPGEQRLNPIVLADLLPAGLEIEAILRPEDGLAGSEYERNGLFAWAGRIAAPNVAEARDDRFVAAIDVLGQPVTLGYIARAVTPGEFAAPGAFAEDMYRPEVFGRSASGRAVIAPRNQTPL